MKNYCYTCMNELTDGSVCQHCKKENTAEDVVYRLRPGTILNSKYLVGNCIGEGGFGITYIGRDLTLDMRVAIKEYFPNGYVNRNNTVDQLVTASTESQRAVFTKGKESFLEEARRIAKFSSEPGIVGVREYFEANGTAYIIMEYLDGVTLSSYIKSNGLFDAPTIFTLMLPITQSLKRMHEAGVIHRDISPDNIIYLRSGSLKLTDFGSARYFTNEQKEMSVLLKQGYAPEEQYRKNGDQGPWTDVYGMCATMYRCITGTIPVDALDRLRSDSLQPPSKMGINIPESMEVVLMYGLAVFKENRCQNMDELGDLMKKALAKEEVSVKPPLIAETDVYQTQLADGYYKSRTQQQFNGASITQPRNTGANAYPGGMPARNAPYQNYPQQNYPPQNYPQQNYSQQNYPQQNYPQQNYPQQNYSAATSKQGPNKKAVAAIIITCAVIIIATVTLMVYLFAFNGNKKDDSGSSSSSVSKVIQDADSAALVTVPDCTGKSLEYASNNFESLGLKVETEYEYSSDVAQGDVIKQSLDADSEVEAGKTITLTVSKGEEPCPYDYSQKLTVTASGGSSYATATLCEWKNGDWSELAEYDARIATNGIGESREGTRTSPVGTHKLGVVLTKGGVSTEMQTYSVTPQTGVISDVNSPYYNMIFEKSNSPDLNKFDLIYDEFSNAAIYIEFNGSGFSSDGVVKGKGSAICVRGKNDLSQSTYGDVDISTSDMSDLLSKLDPSKEPHIELAVD